MATGLSTQLTRQIGEHLVAAKLGRMGYVAAPFAGNVPLFDLVAANEYGRSIPVQVKTINGSSWQFRADMFLDIDIENGYQTVKGKKLLPNPKLICVYILLAEEEHEDQYFIFTLEDLQNYTFGHYKSRKRPKNPNSLHCAIWPKNLESFRDNWKLIIAAFLMHEDRMAVGCIEAQQNQAAKTR